jgi:hypothetical protein
MEISVEATHHGIKAKFHGTDPYDAAYVLSSFPTTHQPDRGYQTLVVGIGILTAIGLCFTLAASFKTNEQPTTRPATERQSPN